jgi:hypothetical protein
MLSGYPDVRWLLGAGDESTRVRQEKPWAGASGQR